MLRLLGSTVSFSRSWMPAHDRALHGSAGPLGGNCNSVEHPGSWYLLADSTQPRRGAARMKLAVMDGDARRDLHRQPWIDEHEAAGGTKHWP